MNPAEIMSAMCLMAVIGLPLGFVAVVVAMWPLVFPVWEM